MNISDMLDGRGRDQDRGKAPALDTNAALGAVECRLTLTGLPSELLDLILSFLSPTDIATLASTCRHLYEHAESDHIWQRIVQSNVPGVRVSTPYPCKTYKELFVAHDPRWFLPKYKIWFSDREVVGKLILVRYDPRRGCIEGYQLVAFSDQSTLETWPANSHVTIHSFKPSVTLHLDKPILNLNANSLENMLRSRRTSLMSTPSRPENGGEGSQSSTVRPEQTSHITWSRPSNILQGEIPMVLGSTAEGVFSNFILAKPLPPSFATTQPASFPFPYGDAWPPPAIPAARRVTGVTLQMLEDPLGMGSHRPTRREQVSDCAFRIRTWVELRGTQHGRHRHDMLWTTTLFDLINMPVSFGVHMGEQIATYATLDPALYTPTEEKPWRGIWVGDYSGHGCEFLLINQQDHEGAEPVELARMADETSEEFERRNKEARLYRGRLEAIKLTGDPNVPRGQYTFIADDLGENGYVTTVREEPFKGARVVRSRGHIADAGFENHKYIESQLILISHDRLAQYWVGFAHISFFERVDIDSFLAPS